MSFSSSERRLGNRPAVNAIIIFVALLLAALSGSMPKAADFPGQRGVEESISAVSFAQPEASPVLDVDGFHPRSAAMPAPHQAQTRSYHPSFETSNSAGALGFWILISLCAALLTAGFAPWLLQWLRRGS